MLHNDISNKGSLVVAFRVDDCLLKYKEKGIIDKTLNIIKGRSLRADIDLNVLSRIDFIYKRTDYTIVLVVAEEYAKDIEKALAKYNVPYSEIMIVKQSLFNLDLSIKLNHGDFSYYVDSNEQRLNLIGNTKALNMTMFDMIFRGR